MRTCTVLSISSRAPFVYATMIDGGAHHLSSALLNRRHVGTPETGPATTSNHRTEGLSEVVAHPEDSFLCFLRAVFRFLTFIRSGLLVTLGLRYLSQQRSHSCPLPRRPPMEREGVGIIKHHGPRSRLQCSCIRPHSAGRGRSTGFCPVTAAKKT